MATLLSLCLYLYEKPSFFRLIMVWQFGFLALIAREGYYTADIVLQLSNTNSFALATRALCGANAAFLLGHSFIFRESKVRRYTSSRSRRTLLPFKLPEAPQPPRYLLILLLIGLYIAVLLFFGHNAIEAAQMGRHNATRLSLGHGAFGTILEGLINAARIILPSMIGYYISIYHNRPAWYSWLINLPIFIVIFMGGTRFPLLFAALGLWITTSAHLRLSFSLLLRAGVIAILLLGGSLFMAANRGSGYTENSFERVESYMAKQGVMHAEGVVLYMSYLAEYTEQYGHHWGRSTGAVFLFWIPRVVWTEKPTLLGYWFPREYMSFSDSGGHSVAFGFVGDAYLDFGLYGAILFWFIIGLLFGRTENWTASTSQNFGDPRVLYTGLIFATIFFAVRSPDTTLIMLIGGFLWIAVFIKLLNMNMRLKKHAFDASSLTSPTVVINNQPYNTP